MTRAFHFALAMASIVTVVAAATIGASQAEVHREYRRAVSVS